MSDSAVAPSGKGTPSSNATKKRAELARVAARLAMAAASSLPALILMTDERLPNPAGAAAALPRGSAVIVRARTDVERRHLALALREIARARGLFLLIAGDPALAAKIGADGVHLPEARIGEAAAIRSCRSWLITAAAHSPAAFGHTAGVDAMILSAVFATASHPGRAALGPVRAAAMARLSPLPVYALGGITAQNAKQLNGFCGIAAIGALAV